MPPVDTTTKPLDELGRRAWIRYQLELRGWSYTKIAREIGVTRATVRKAVLQPYPKMEREIAKRLGVRPEEIWPKRYARRADLAVRRQGSLHSTHTASLPAPAPETNGKSAGAE